MATLWNTYSTEVLARDAADELRAAGVPARDIRVLTGPLLRDLRREPAPGFAGPVGPNAPEGSFAPGVRLPRRHDTGNFASRPGRQREGCFADTDRELIAIYRDGAERSHVVGDLGLRQHLRQAALDDVATERVIAELHEGRAAVLAEVAEIAPSEAQSRLEKFAHAA
jgi:hypothetical protein